MTRASQIGFETGDNEYASYATAHSCTHRFLAGELLEEVQNRHKALAVDLYDRAIALTRAHQYLQEEVLANELAARFYLEWNKPRLAWAFSIWKTT